MDENRENDVLMMELPEYEEEFPPFAEAETQDISFVVNKEEIYKRNRIIAAEEQSKILIEEEKTKTEKKDKFEKIFSEAKAEVDKKEKKDRVITTLTVGFAIVVIAVLISLLIVNPLYRGYW